MSTAQPSIPCTFDGCRKTLKDVNALMAHTSAVHRRCPVANCANPGPFLSNKHFNRHQLQAHPPTPSVQQPVPATGNPLYRSQSFGDINLPAHLHPREPTPYRSLVEMDHVRRKRDEEIILVAIAEGMPLPDHLMIRDGMLFPRDGHKKEDDWLYERPANETEEQRRYRHARLDALAAESEAKARAEMAREERGGM